MAERRRKRGHWVSVAPFVLLGIVLMAAWWTLTSRVPEGPVEPLKIIPFTAEPGPQYHPTFSPDGTQIAFVWKTDQEKTDIHVRRVDGKGSLQLTDHPGQDLDPAWSPDGSQIAFWRHSEGKGEILTISSLGGPERKRLTAQWPGLSESRGLSWALLTTSAVRLLNSSPPLAWT